MCFKNVCELSISQTPQPPAYSQPTQACQNDITVLPNPYVDCYGNPVANGDCSFVGQPYGGFVDQNVSPMSMSSDGVVTSPSSDGQYPVDFSPTSYGVNGSAGHYPLYTRDSWRYRQPGYDLYSLSNYLQDLPGIDEEFPDGGDLSDFKFTITPATSLTDNGELSQNTLCKVCGDTSSGNHFGVMSCEACKSFFRRSVRASSRYACRASRNCAIEKHTRNRCQYCRLQKCMEMGMRKEGMQFNVYRLVTVNYLFLLFFLSAVQEERTPQMTKQQPQRANTPTQLGFPSYTTLPPPPPPMFRTFDSPTSPIPTILGQNSRLFGSLPNLKMQFGQDIPHGTSLSNLLPSTSDVFPSQFMPTSTIGEPSGPGMPLHCGPQSQVSANVLLNADIQADEPPEQVTFTETGVKLEDIFEGARQSLLKIIEWGKRIPAFTLLSLDDQVKLLKRSWCEHVLLKLCTRMGPRSDTIMLSSGLTCRRDQIDDPEIRRVVENLTREVAYWLDILNVDRVEMACLKGIILFNPGECMHPWKYLAIS